MEKYDLKEKCIKLIEDGKNVSEIAQLLGYSRTYISNLIKDDKQYKFIRQNRKIKVYKRNHYKQMTIHIPTEFIKGIGVTEDKNINDFVNVFFDENNEQIIITKV